MSKAQQRKGAEGERELTAHLRRAGYPVEWGGSMTYGTVPDLSGLPGVHIECKRRERLNLTEAMAQAVRDAERFRDGAPAVFHRRNNQPWLVTMRLTEWLGLYSIARSAPDLDHDAHAFFYTQPHVNPVKKGDSPMDHFWDVETPVIVNTSKNVIRYFPEARMLSISKPDWKEKKSGETKQGKTVLLDLEAVAKNPAAVTLLTRVLADLKK